MSRSREQINRTADISTLRQVFGRGTIGLVNKTRPGRETDNPTALDWEAIDRRCEELGAMGTDEKAELIGASRATYYRWRNGYSDITLGRAVDVVTRLGLNLVDVLTVEAAGPRPSPPPAPPKPPAGPHTPKPPAGPKHEGMEAAA